MLFFFLKLCYIDSDNLSRCRLAVWRQLPKLISAGPTPVTCSKVKAPLGGAFLFRKKVRESDPERGFCEEARSTVRCAPQNQTSARAQSRQIEKNLRSRHLLKSKSSVWRSFFV